MPSGNINSYGADWLIIAQNSYSNSSGTRIYKNTGFASEYIQTSSQHRWYTAPSGTAGNAISFTQAMTLNASGNLSIGNTNDTFKLDVSGTGRYRVSSDRNLAIRFDSNITLSAQSDTGAPESLRMYADTFRIYTATTAAGLTERFTIANTGAATFSSSVTAGGLVTINKQNEGLILTAGTNTDASYMSTRANNGTGWLIMGSQGTTAGYIQSGTGANESAITTVGTYALSIGTNQIERLRINGSTGAATFSGSITTGGGTRQAIVSVGAQDASTVTLSTIMPSVNFNGNFVSLTLQILSTDGGSVNSSIINCSRNSGTTWTYSLVNTNGSANLITLTFGGTSAAPTLAISGTSLSLYSVTYSVLVR